MIDTAHTVAAPAAEEPHTVACGHWRDALASIARLRGWARRGEHDRALAALDAALRAIAALDTAEAAAPRWAGTAERLRAELDALVR